MALKLNNYCNFNSRPSPPVVSAVATQPSAESGDESDSVYPSHTPHRRGGRRGGPCQSKEYGIEVAKSCHPSLPCVTITNNCYFRYFINIKK